MKIWLVFYVASQLAGSLGPYSRGGCDHKLTEVLTEMSDKATSSGQVKVICEQADNQPFMALDADMKKDFGK